MSPQTVRASPSCSVATDSGTVPLVRASLMCVEGPHWPLKEEPSYDALFLARQGMRAGPRARGL